MAVLTKQFGQGMLGIANADIDLVGDTIKLLLLTTSATINIDTTDFYDDVSAAELANATGYTTGGPTLASKALTYDSTSDQVRWDFADPSWAFSAVKSLRYGVPYKDTGVAGTSALIGYIDLDPANSGNISIPIGTYSLAIDATGLLYWDVT